MPETNQQKTQEKADGNAQLKNHNPNQQHNMKKEALGPNTRR